MAEYIDREELKKHLDIEISFGGVENKFLVFDKIDTCKTADVIERSKIDKAIEEIDNLDLNRVAMEYEDRFYGFQLEVIEILKRNIGE